MREVRFLDLERKIQEKFYTHVKVIENQYQEARRFTESLVDRGRTELFEVICKVCNLKASIESNRVVVHKVCCFAMNLIE